MIRLPGEDELRCFKRRIKKQVDKPLGTNIYGETKNLMIRWIETVFNANKAVKTTASVPDMQGQ